MALDVIRALSLTSSRLEKEEILLENQDDLVLKDAFRLALDPMVNFHIKKVPEPDASLGVIQPPERMTLGTALREIETKIASRMLRGHDARDHLAWLLGVVSKDDREVLCRVIGRNLKCGVSEATVQKIWPDLQLSYPCMLVSPMDAKTKLKFPCVVQTKMDGMRFNAHVTDGSVTFRTRVGKELAFAGLPIESDFKKLPEGVYDGELLVANCDRKTGNGILTKFQKGTGKASEGKDIHAKLWDVIPMEGFRAGAHAQPYLERFRVLSGLLKAARPATIALVQTWLDVASIEDAQSIYKEQLAKGEEGVILKDPMGGWEDKRVTHQVKMKAELEADLMCVGYTEGTGKYKGMIGSLFVESRGREVRTAVGTGLNDEERSRDPNEFVGKIVAVKYNALITDKKTGERSLFLPVFVEIRDDKTTADVL